MVAELQVTGRAQLVKLAADLKAAGSEARGLRRELLRANRVLAAPLVAAVKESALTNLPKHGGLNEYIAGSKFSILTRTTGSGAGLRIKAAKAGGRKGQHDLEAIDAGEFRHPVFGSRVWVAQQVPSGWFTKPLNEAAPVIRKELVFAMNIIARRIEKGMF